MWEVQEDLRNERSVHRKAVARFARDNATLTQDVLGLTPKPANCMHSAPSVPRDSRKQSQELRLFLLWILSCKNQQFQIPSITATLEASLEVGY